MNKLENAAIYVRIYLEKAIIYLQKLSAKQKISIAINKYLKCKITILEREEILEEQMFLIDKLMNKRDELDRQLEQLKK